MTAKLTFLRAQLQHGRETIVKEVERGLKTPQKATLGGESRKVGR